MKLRPYWNYYGGKWRAAPLYPAPRHGLIVESHAGAAGYAMRYADRDVLLIEKYPVVAEMWRFLIGASESDVLSIPLVEDIRDLPDRVPEGARYLVGFLLNAATTQPRTRLSAGNRRNQALGRKLAGWTAARRDLVASQLRYTRHWRVIEGCYSDAPDVEATWFVDPPYERAGKYYAFGSKQIDYRHLADWCRSRRGQVIACEQDGASWLPFRPLASVKARFKNKRSAEAVWTNDGALEAA